VGNGKASDATTLMWNYNQNIFIAATTFPRLRVENGYKIYKNYGKLLHKIVFDDNV